MKNDSQKLRISIKRWLLFFMIGLIVSGVTAFNVPAGINWLYANVHIAPADDWLSTVQEAIADTNSKYPFLFYGYDWLAFAHIIIAIAFIGPYKNPLQNEWVIEFGMIACALVIPATLIMGAMRHIPIWWQIIDCMFGVIGIIPLAIIWVKIQQLKLEKTVFWNAVIRKAKKHIVPGLKLAEA